MSDEDWDAIMLVSEWLGLFKGATAKMSTNKKPMLSETHTIFRTAPFNRLSSQVSVIFLRRSIPPMARLRGNCGTGLSKLI
jgi:hypothetical protein